MRIQNEVENELENRSYWKILADLLGWKLIGWTNRSVATYSTPTSSIYRQTIEIYGNQRDDIVKAIQRGGDHA